MGGWTDGWIDDGWINGWNIPQLPQLLKKNEVVNSSVLSILLNVGIYFVAGM